MNDTPLSPAPLSPAEAAILASGLPFTAKELPSLIREVARALPATDATVATALLKLRRRGYVGRLADLASRAGIAWARREDVRAAAETVGSIDACDDTLRAALDAALFSRLRDAGRTPEAALDALTAEIAETGGALTPPRLHELATAIAIAHAHPDPAGFANAARVAEESRRSERRSAEVAARTSKREEIRRLRAWEQSLVPFQPVPDLLGCTAKEALRWVAAGLIPVARRLPGKSGERWEFDPAELAPLRAEVPLWRTRETTPAAPAIPQGRGANAAIARVAALDRYAAHFATARALVRRITLVTGPTNSGKSYLALNRLAEAQSGLALAPLRLLAHEFREALASRGVLASLTTGEERLLVPGSKHIAATVEMCPFRTPVDIAMIDEAQMLHDPDRGAAWTAAIMGAPAREIFVLGAPDCIPMVRRIAALCGDALDEVSLERKGPLVAARAPVGLGDLHKGDALIAFSRREVMDLRAELIRRGRRVAVVYGALSPEVRRAEAARFNSGDADILVATDAIGMGLNLNIRRVIFSAMQKFDGTQRRDLTVQEVKQIGGRAGRYGLHEEGVVAVLAGAGSPEVLKALLNAMAVAPPELRPLVQPDADIIAAVAAEIGSTSLFGVLARIKRAVLRKDDPNYRLADLEAAMSIATAIDGVTRLTLLERWTYALCPIDLRDNGVARLSRWALEHGAGRAVAPPEAGKLPPPDRASSDELQRGEKVQRRLVAWRWMAQRFPEAYAETREAEAETARLNAWIEDVLRQQRKTARSPVLKVAR